MQNSPRTTGSFAIQISHSGQERYVHGKPHIKKFNPLPFGEIVEQYFQKHPNEYLEIHCGERAYRMSELDANQYNKFGDCKPSLFLPHLCAFTEYWWPVKNIKIVVYWAYDDKTLCQINFCNHLAKICGAEFVWSSVERNATKFADLGRYI